MPGEHNYAVNLTDAASSHAFVCSFDVNLLYKPDVDRGPEGQTELVEVESNISWS